MPGGQLGTSQDAQGPFDDRRGRNPIDITHRKHRGPFRMEQLLARALHCTTLHCTTLHRTTLHRTTLHRTTVHRTTVLCATLLCATFLVSACSGGGGSSGARDTQAPTVEHVDPPAGGQTIAIDSTISAQLSETIDPTSVHTDLIEVTVAGIAVAGSTGLSVDGTSIVFTPSDLLARGATHDVVLQVGATDVAGNPLEFPFQWSFTTTRWGPMDVVAEAGGIGGGPSVKQLVVDSVGDTTFGYRDFASANNRIVVRRYDANLGWVPEELVIADATASAPLFAVDAAGNVLMVHTRFESTSGDSILDARLYSTGSGWSAPTTLRSSQDSIVDVDLDVAANGHAAVIWRELRQPTPVLVAATFQPGVGWSTPEELINYSATLVPPQIRSPFSPRIAVDDSGRAVARWSEANNCCFGGWVDVLGRYLPGSGWDQVDVAPGSGSNLAETSPTPTVITLLPGGDTAISVRTFESGSGAGTRVIASRYDVSANSIRESPFLDSGTADFVLDPNIAMDANGVLVITWIEQHSNDPLNARAMFATYVDGLGFAPAEIVGSPLAGALVSGPLAGAPDGTAILVLRHSDANGSTIRASRFEPTVGWSSYEAIGPTTPDSPYSTLALDLSASGVAHAVWQQTVDVNTTYRFLDARHE